MRRALRQMAPATADLDGAGQSPAGIALSYLVFGLTWIAIGDIILLWKGLETVSAFWAELAKGSTFVILSSLLIYVLVSRCPEPPQHRATRRHHRHA